MRPTEDIGYPTFLLMLMVFVGLALLSNFTRAEVPVQEFTQNEIIIESNH